MRSDAARDDHPGLSPAPQERGEAIAERFDRAAPQYDQHAQVQRLAAQRLAAADQSMLPPESCRRALELGCGTGLLTEQLIGPYAAADWTITDLSPRMVERCRAEDRNLVPAGRRDYQVMDARRITALGPLDLIASNLTFQWFEDLASVATAATERLAPGGLLVFNTLGAESFGYWRQVGPTIGRPADRAAATHPRRDRRGTDHGLPPRLRGSLCVGSDCRDIGRTPPRASARSCDASSPSAPARQCATSR